MRRSCFRRAPNRPAQYSFNPIRHTVDKFIVDAATGEMRQYKTERTTNYLEVGILGSVQRSVALRLRHVTLWHSIGRRGLLNGVTCSIVPTHGGTGREQYLTGSKRECSYSDTTETLPRTVECFTESLVGGS